MSLTSPQDLSDGSVYTSSAFPLSTPRQSETAPAPGVVTHQPRTRTRLINARVSYMPAPKTPVAPWRDFKSCPRRAYLEESVLDSQRPEQQARSQVRPRWTLGSRTGNSPGSHQTSAPARTDYQATHQPPKPLYGDSSDTSSRSPSPSPSIVHSVPAHRRRGDHSVIRHTEALGSAACDSGLEFFWL